MQSQSHSHSHACRGCASSVYKVASSPSPLMKATLAYKHPMHLKQDECHCAACRVREAAATTAPSLSCMQPFAAREESFCESHPLALIPYHKSQYSKQQRDFDSCAACGKHSAVPQDKETLPSLELVSTQTSSTEHPYHNLQLIKPSNNSISLSEYHGSNCIACMEDLHSVVHCMHSQGSNLACGSCKGVAPHHHMLAPEPLQMEAPSSHREHLHACAAHMHPHTAIHTHLHHLLPDRSLDLIHRYGLNEQDTPTLLPNNPVVIDAPPLAMSRSLPPVLYSKLPTNAIDAHAESPCCITHLYDKPTINRPMLDACRIGPDVCHRQPKDFSGAQAYQMAPSDSYGKNYRSAPGCLVAPDSNPQAQSVNTAHACCNTPVITPQAKSCHIAPVRADASTHNAFPTAPMMHVPPEACRMEATAYDKVATKQENGPSCVETERNKDDEFWKGVPTIKNQNTRGVNVGRGRPFGRKMEMPNRGRGRGGGGDGWQLQNKRRRENNANGDNANGNTWEAGFKKNVDAGEKNSTWENSGWENPNANMNNNKNNNNKDTWVWG